MMEIKHLRIDFIFNKIKMAKKNQKKVKFSISAKVLKKKDIKKTDVLECLLKKRKKWKKSRKTVQDSLLEIYGNILFQNNILNTKLNRSNEKAEKVLKRIEIFELSMEKNGQTQLTNKHSSKNHDESDIEDCKTHDKYNNSKNNRTSLKNQKNDITKNNEITSKNDNRKLKKETLNKDLCYKKKDSEVIVLTSDFNVENAVPEEECASSKFPIKESKKINESTVESQKNNNRRICGISSSTPKGIDVSDDNAHRRGNVVSFRRTSRARVLDEEHVHSFRHCLLRFEI